MPARWEFGLRHQGVREVHSGKAQPGTPSRQRGEDDPHHEVLRQRRSRRNGGNVRSRIPAAQNCRRFGEQLRQGGAREGRHPAGGNHFRAPGRKNADRTGAFREERNSRRRVPERTGRKPGTHAQGARRHGRPAPRNDGRNPSHAGRKAREKQAGVQRGDAEGHVGSGRKQILRQRGSPPGRVLRLRTGRNRERGVEA